ncbi:MAG: hypothetical protein JNK67_21380 [Alphaproteobacteria bacterium]|nr:hypothetical protein [Alphaproteobacteria bacterium]
MGAALRHLPSLIGVFLGIYFSKNSPLGNPAVLPLLGLLVLYLSLAIGRGMFPTNPATAMWLIEPWSLSQIVVVALATEALIWISVSAPGLLGSPASGDAYSNALVGAATAFVGAAWTKEIAESKGPFLSHVQFKLSAEAFGKRHQLKAADGDAWHACFSDAKVAGWDFAARRKRCEILEGYLARRPGTTRPDSRP